MIISILILATILLVSLYGFFGKIDLTHFALSPFEFINKKKYYQIITSGFLHADYTHLLFNSLTFLFFAFEFEKISGGLNFLLIYFGSMIIADIPSIAKHRNNRNYLSLGASGAISGIVFASIFLNPGMKLILFPLPIPIPGYIYGVLYLIYCTIAQKKLNDKINHSAHFWGAFGGFLLSIILMSEKIADFVAYFQ